MTRKIINFLSSFCISSWKNNFVFCILFCADIELLPEKSGISMPQKQKDTRKGRISDPLVKKKPVFHEGGAYSPGNFPIKKFKKRFFLKFQFFNFFRQYGTKTHGVFLQEGFLRKRPHKGRLFLGGGDLQKATSQRLSFKLSIPQGKLIAKRNTSLSFPSFCSLFRLFWKRINIPHGNVVFLKINAQRGF